MVNYTYGISPEQYNELLTKQKHCCKICKRPETDFARKLAIDHDHGTGEIFGLLCQMCNHTLIGKYRDPEIFKAAARYLKQGTGWFVPEDKKKPKKYGRKKRVRVRKG